MQRKILRLICLAALAVPASLMAEVNVNVHVGVPGPRVVVHGPPAALFQAPPLFLAPPQLGFYVGVDVPYDIVFASNFYYLYFNNGWYRSHYYNGPWVMLPREYLPPVIRRHRLDSIRSYRDNEYRVYYRDRDYYRGRHHRPEWKGERREDHRRGKEELRQERRHGREDFRGDRGRGHERRRGD